MIVRATEWMSGRWWVALAVAMSFVLVARTGTVGAPAEAHNAGGVNSLGDRRAAYSAATFSGSGPTATEGSGSLAPTTQRGSALLSLERHVRHLERRVIALQGALTLERSRTRVLEASYQDLEGQFDDVTLSVRGLAEASAPRPVDNEQPNGSARDLAADPDTARTTRQER